MNKFFTKKLLPAVTVKDTDAALSLAEALLKGGLDVLEITFRTEAAISAIRAVTREFPDLFVGAGTILSPDQVKKAVDAGAQFGLSPGLNEEVVRSAREHNFPFIPGITTPSEIEKALGLGCRVLKLFPVHLLGGVAYLKSMEAPYGHTGVQFIPMGGINISNVREYVQCKSVLAAGGSWLASKESVSKQDFKAITETVKKSVEIARIG